MHGHPGRLLFASYWALLLGMFVLSGPLDAATGAVLELRSEYTAVEQLGKFVLLLIVLVAVLAHSQLRTVVETQAALVFLALGVILYLAESNMLAEKLAPPLGAGLFLITLGVLVRQRAWWAAGMIVLACGAITVGVLSDALHEGRLGEALPRPLRALLMRFNEERADTIGLALVASAALLRFADLLARWVMQARLAAALYLGAMGLIVAGNSFLHHQYDPGPQLWAVAFGLAAAGFATIVLANHLLLPPAARLKLYRERHFYAFLYFGFVALPAVHDQEGVANFVLLWLPALSYWLWQLYEPRLRAQRQTLAEP